MAKSGQSFTPRQMAQQRLKAARSNLLLVVILTLVNIVLLIAGSETFMLFSASIPYYAVCFPVIWGNFELFLVGCVLAFILIVLYFLCWLLSKKRPGWLTVALVLFILDTVGLVALYILAEEISGIVDLLIHVWVLYYLFSGISNAKKLKNLPEVTEAAQEEEPVLQEYSTPLRRADEDMKCRVLLQSEYGGHRVCYRRVKRVNELVIDGQVYDEYEALVELPHTLTARIAGHTYEVGCNEQNRMFFRVDGVEIVKKIRWV